MHRSSKLLPATIVLALTGPGIALPARAAEGTLEIRPDPLELLLLIAMFIALVFPVNAFVVRPLLRVLEARTERIEGARQRAESLSAQADESLARYREAVDGAKQQSEVERRTLLEQARKEQGRVTADARVQSESEIERARGEVQAALVGARATLAREAEVLAREAVQRILGRGLA